MAVGRLNLPQRLDVIPATEVGELIETTDREFVQLERVAAEARAEAEEQERLAAAEGVDPKSSSWTMMRLQRFLHGLHEEAGRDASAIVEVAQQRARLRLDEARAEADARGRGLTTDWYPESAVATTPAPSAGAFGPALGSLVVTPQPTPTPGPAARQSLAARDDTDGLQASPVQSDANAVGGTALVTAPASAPAGSVAPPEATSNQFLDEHFWGPSPERASEPTAVAAFAAHASPPVPVRAPAPARVPSPTPDPAHAPPAPAARARREAPVVAAPVIAAAPPQPAKTRRQVKPRDKRGAVSRIPFSAVLEVLAVLAILVFILLRLS
jgi:cell division septum initiation protein DivIVA